MEVQELIAGARDAMTVKRVYGDPYEKNGMTIIPAAVVRGGGGAGGEEHADDKGQGGGFGLVARPSGAWIVDGEKATWKPAVDVNRIVLGGQIVALVAVLVAGRVLFEQSKRRHTLLDAFESIPRRRRPARFGR